MANWYVSQSGAGTGTGTTYANRMSVSTFNGKASGTFSAGDTVYICGATSSQIQNKNMNGSTDNYILIRGDYPGDLSSLRVSGGQAFRIDGNSWLHFDNVNFKGSASGGDNDGLLSNGAAANTANQPQLGHRRYSPHQSHS